MFALAPLVGMAHRMFPPRLRRGTRHPDAPSSPCFAAESVRVDTLRALPENVAAPRRLPVGTPIRDLAGAWRFRWPP